MPIQDVSWKDYGISQSELKDIRTFVKRISHRFYRGQLFVTHNGEMPTESLIEKYSGKLFEPDVKKIALFRKNVKDADTIIDVAGGTSPAMLYLLHKKIIKKAYMIDINPFFLEVTKSIADSFDIEGLVPVESDILKVKPSDYKDADMVLLHGVFDRPNISRIGGKRYPFAMGVESISIIFDIVLQLAPKVYYLNFCREKGEDCLLLNELDKHLVLRHWGAVRTRRIKLPSNPVLYGFDEVLVTKR